MVYVMIFDFRKYRLCYTSDFGGTIAKKPRSNGRIVSWFDPSHNRAFALAEIVKDTPDKLVWKDRSGRKHFLEPLTAEVYNKHVKPQIGQTAPDLTTDAEVLKFFLG
jgi:hypothetical protein